MSTDYDPLSDEAYLEWVRNQKDVYPRDAWQEARRRAQEDRNGLRDENKRLWGDLEECGRAINTRDREIKLLRDLLRDLVRTNHLATAYTDRVKAVKAASVALGGR